MTTHYSMGWLPDLPDIRDFAPDDPKDTPQLLDSQRSVATWFQKSKSATIQAPPSEVNLVKWFSPVEDQESLGSCTANAGVALLEYYENRAFGSFVDGSLPLLPVCNPMGPPVLQNMGPGEQLVSTAAESATRWAAASINFSTRSATA